MRTITSPVGRYPGTIDMPDYYTWDHLIAWDEAIDAANLETVPLKRIRIQSGVVLGMVLAWHIEGLPEHPDSIPATPIKPALELVTWLMGEIGKVIHGDETVDVPLSGASGDG